MKFSTLPRYLLGDRTAILEIASSRSSIWCGLLFTLSAGFAREYDGEDLVHEPWHLFRPLLASTATATVLYGIVAYARGKKGPVSGTGEFGPPNDLRCFLGLFWMTAPLAWIYALPYERWLSPIEAIEANLWTLGLVAAWRVLLIIRVISVVYEFSVVHTFFLVMFFADAMVFLGVAFSPVPLIDVMGGIRRSEREALIVGTTRSLFSVAVFSAPIWIIWGLIAVNRIRAGRKARAATDAGTPTSALNSHAFASPVAPPSTIRPLWLLAIGSLVIWIPVLPWTQREQMNRYAVEQLLESGEVNRAIARMSAHEPGDFPPQWEPPPRPQHGDLAWAEPPVVKIVRAVRAEKPKPWVAQRFVDKVDLRLQGLFFGRLGSWDLLLISGQHPDPEYRFIPERLRKKYGIEDVDGRREKLELLEFLFEFHHDMDPELRTALEGLHASLLDPSKDPAQ